MKSRLILVLTAAGVLAIGAVGLIRPAHADSPATQPAPSTGPAIATDAQKELDQLKGAYTKLKSIQIIGSVTLHAETTDKVTPDEHNTFISSFLAPNFFRHEMKDDVTLGSNGQTSYLFVPRVNGYFSNPAPAARANLDDLGDEVSEALRQQNISLALAICSDPSKELLDGIQTVIKAPDQQIEGATYTALKLTMPGVDATLLIDPQTHLARRWTVDPTEQIRSQGAGDLKSLLITVDFSSTTPDADVKAVDFAWAPPAGATDIAAQRQQQLPQLAGKAAPAFQLKGMDGKTVSDADLKGSVYVLDFWASWCGPCVQSLPELDKIYQDHKAAGLKVFAVNQGEDRPTVEQFVNTSKITIPVLLDGDQTVGNLYQANAIPETVVVGKDGIVRKVFVGAGNDKKILKEVEAALKADK